MGGNFSIIKSNEEINKNGVIELFNKMDSIAADYITTESFTDMHNLLEDEYCSKLVVLTTDILTTKLKPYEISYLDKRVKFGSDVTSKMVKENIAHFNKNTVEELDIKDVNKKTSVCKGIAKFYIKIAHIYGAIVTAMNPVYEYKDEDGEIKQITLDNRDKLNEDIVSKVSKISNFCNQRIISLSSEIINTKDEQLKKIKPDICSINKKEIMDEKGDTKTVIETSGFKELEKLYMDDYSDGIFSMSKESKKKYYKDVETLDKAINGTKGSNPPATSFSTIKLNPYHNTEECMLPNGLPEALIDDTSSMFKEYGELIRKMITTSEKTQVELLGQLKQIFSFEKENGEVKAKLQENLNDYKLNKISKKCRDIIINMYIDCEKDFIKGLNIYQSIVEDLKANDILNNNQGLPNETPIEIDDNDKGEEIKLIKLNDNDNDEEINYSMKNDEQLKSLIRDDDEQFNSLFENEKKYDNNELKDLKNEIKELINKNENDKKINEKLLELKAKMHNIDKEKSLPKDDDDENEGYDSLELAAQNMEPYNKEKQVKFEKHTIEKVINTLDSFKTLIPLMKEFKYT
jgi:hypothetical protein